jgi:hypothetical protein
MFYCSLHHKGNAAIARNFACFVEACARHTVAAEAARKEFKCHSGTCSGDVEWLACDAVCVVGGRGAAKIDDTITGFI